MADFLMPVLGADMKTGELIAWLKRPGDTVERGDVIAEVDTEKAVVEVEVLFGGVIEKLIVEPGEKVPVGTVLAIIQPAPGQERAAEEAARLALSAPQEPAFRPRATPTLRRAVAPPAAAGTGRLRVSPAARLLAEQRAVDLTSLKGSGPGGRIMIRDIEEAAAAMAARPVVSPEEERRLRMRQAIASAMSRSHREIPHFHITTTIDVTDALSWLATQNASKPVADRMLYAVLLLKAAALAVRRVPEVNAVWSGEQAERKESINFGVAISLRNGGLVAPAIHDTDKLVLEDLMSALRDLVQRARSGRLRSSEISDPTITLTNLGETGAESVLGLIYPPQVALVGFGRVVDRPAVVGASIQPRKLVTASLAGDHRALDGYRGSVYLSEIERLLAMPEGL